MQRTRKKAGVIRDAVDEWEAEGLLDSMTAERLRGNLEQVWIDWKKLATISIRIAIACIVIAVFSLLADEAILAFLEALLQMGAYGKMTLCGMIAAAFFWWGIRRRSIKPHKVRTTEVIFLFGVLFIAAAIAFLGEAVSAGPENATLLVLVAAGVYAVLGFAIPSLLVWIVALGCFGAWFGLITGYISGWGAYYMGMNYPLRFVLFGAFLTVCGYLLKLWENVAPLERATRIIGLLYFFVALWILSIFGNYGDMDVWYDAPQYELFHWSLLFGAAAAGAIYIGLRTDDGVMRGFGMTFLFINLYTRYCEYFWNSLHKALFFAVMGASFWLIGAKAEEIWSLGGRTRKHSDSRHDDGPAVG